MHNSCLMSLSPTFITHLSNLALLTHTGERVDTINTLGVGWTDRGDTLINVCLTLGPCVP